MDKWEYKIKEFKTSHSFGDIVFEATKEVEKEGMFGGTKTKKITNRIIAEEIEIIFNSLGQEGWELCGVAPLIMTSNIGPGSNTDRVFFVFKRRKTHAEI